MDFLEKLLKRHMENSSIKSVEDFEEEDVDDIEFEEERADGLPSVKDYAIPFYVFQHDDGKSKWYTVHDKYYHYCWGTGSDLTGVKRVVLNMLNKIPTFQDIHWALVKLSENDQGGYTQMFIDRFKMGEGYADYWRSKNLELRKKSDPPPIYADLYTSVDNEGIAQQVKGCNVSFLDLSFIKEALAVIKIKKWVRDINDKEVRRAVKAIRNYKGGKK